MIFYHEIYKILFIFDGSNHFLICEINRIIVYWSLSYSLVKLHYFQFAFLENCVYKKQKKSIKDQRNFCSNTFFQVFANFVSAHSKIWCSRFSYEKNDITFFIPQVGDLPEIEECLFLTTTMECNSFLNINFVSSLNHQNVNLW